MSIFNKSNVDFTKQPMFLGEPLNVARYDKAKYSKFHKLTEQQKGFFWRPERTDLTRDMNDFANKMSEVEKFVFISNLQYQILLDSVQGRCPVQLFGRICSLPELENWLVWWSASETIHSHSYTYIIENVFPNSSEVYDQIMVSDAILERAGMVSDFYEELEKAIVAYESNPNTGNTRHVKECLFKAMVGVYILEAVRFYVSFACSYSFAENGKMDGNAKIISEINRDEFLHQGATHFIITRWLKGLDDPEMTEIANNNKHQIVEMFKATYDQEKAWIKHLMQHGNIQGLNEEILTLKLDYLCKQALDNLGVSQNVFTVSENPLPWMDSYTKSSGVQVAPQESEITSYLADALDMTEDISDLEFDL